MSVRGKGKMRARHHRAAKALAQGRSGSEAGVRSGLKSKRAAAGVTVAEWQRLPAFRALVADYAEKAMSGEEWDERNALQARGLLPTRIHFDGQGIVTGGVCDIDRAMERQGNALGRLKDRHILSGPNGGAVQHELSVVSVEELQRRLDEHTKALKTEKRASR